MEFTAQARFQRVSPQKARLVLDLIQGQRVSDALSTLAFTKKRVAGPVEKLLRSAVDNANYLSQEKGLDVDVDDLVVKSAVAGDGPRLKRIRPAPMGRAFRYVRRMSHIVIVLGERASKGAAVSMSKGSARTASSAPAAKAKTAAGSGTGAAKKKKPAVRNWSKTGAAR
jgi:large subunit ribosomal protein L22